MSATFRFGLLSTVLTLAACGGGGGGSAPVTPTPAGTTTQVSGSVVKGPVAGANVCAYAVAAGAKGAALGSCVATDASGNYTLSVPANSGALWLEALGGSYTDETTGASTPLPAGSALVSLIDANGAAVSAYLTPLTTLALNAAKASAAGGTLDSGTFATAAAQLLTTLSLPNTLNLNSTAPAFGTSANAYGTALAAISRMVADGTSLASILATVQPSQLQAAYAAAAASNLPPTGDGGGTTPPAGANVTTTRGSVTSDNSAVASFTPQGSATNANQGAFTTVVSDGYELYILRNVIGTADANGNSAGVALQAFTVSVFNGGAPSVSFSETTYVRGAAPSVARSCAAGCPGVSLTRTSNGKGLTLSFTDARFTGTAPDAGTPAPVPLVFNGSVTAEMSSGYVFFSQLPHATAGSLTIDGVATPLLYSTVDYAFLNDAQPELYPTINLRTAGGAVQVRHVPDQSVERTYGVIYTPASNAAIYNANLTAANLVSTTSGYTIDLTSTLPLTGGSGAAQAAITAQVSVGKPGGSLSASGGEASFTPLYSSVSGADDKLIFSFRARTPAGSFTQPSVSVTLRHGVVVSFNTSSSSGKLYACDNVGSIFMAKCSGTVSLSADQRSLTFTGFAAALNLDPSKPIIYNGTLTAAGG